MNILCLDLNAKIKIIAAYQLAKNDDLKKPKETINKI